MAMKSIEIMKMPPLGETGIVIVWEGKDKIPFYTTQTIEEPETPKSVSKALLDLARRIEKEHLEGKI